MPAAAGRPWGRGLRLLAITVVLVAAAGLLPQAAAVFSSVTSNTTASISAAASYGLTQPGGTAGCITDTGSGGACATAASLSGGTKDIAVSPDGKTVYVSGGLTISVFSRNSGTGALTQLAGTNGCVSDTGTGVITALAGTAGCITATGNGGACTTGKSVTGGGWEGIAISQDGKTVYVIGNGGGNTHVAAFSRNSGTGALTQLAGTGACVSDDGYADGVAAQCAVGHGMYNIGIEGIAVTPDNTGVYISGFNTRVVLAFSRNTTTGVITQLAGTAGCTSEDGSGGVCTVGHDLGCANGVTISPDSTSVYIASPCAAAIDVFSRNTSTNALTQSAGTAGCISEGGNGGTCVSGKALTWEEAEAVSPDGQDVYNVGGGVVTVLRRDAATGTLSQSSGTDACYTRDGSDNGTPGACTSSSTVSGGAGLMLSPDGADLYITDGGTGVLIFTRTR